MISDIPLSKHPVFGFTILGSGSRGNAAVIHCPQGKLLLDAGFTAKVLKNRMQECGVDPGEIRAVLVTHEHEDHIKGCRVFANSIGVPLYVTPETCRVMRSRQQVPDRTVLITPGCRFDLCGVTVEPFSICHDVVDAVAYTFRCGTYKLGYATDLGVMNLLAKTKLRGCDALVIESNYDPESLRNSGRPIQVKRRIMGHHGHLSNADCMAALGELVQKNTRKVIFAHLSSECNRPDLVLHMARHCFEELKRADVEYCVADQANPLKTCWIA